MKSVGLRIKKIKPLDDELLAYSVEETDLSFEKFLGGPDDDINIRIDRVSTNYGFGDLDEKETKQRFEDRSR